MKVPKTARFRLRIRRL